MKSLLRAMCFLSFRESAERTLLLTVLLCSCSMRAQAQNIEGQLVASQFGEWKVQSIGLGFSFDPASCQLSAGGKNFAAFSNGTPIKVVDENPGLTEVSNATVYAHVDPSSCSVSLGGLAYGHTSFYLTSGTGGLQEALTNGIQRTGGSNTVILNAEWYVLVAPSNPATVIASVQGSTALGLVDVTTTPYTNYSWNGTQYIGNTTAGASIPATNLLLKGAGTLGVSTPATPGTDFVIPSGSITGTAANLSGTPNLPNGTAATTQATNDNTTKIATDAFVKTAVSGNSSYTAGTGGVAANTVVMGDGTGNVIPFVNSTTSTANYGLYTGIATATAAVGTPVPVANSSGQLVVCQFDATPVVGHTVIGSLTTSGDCHDAGITGNYVTPYMPIVGWVQSVSGTLGTVRMAGLGVWGSANLIVNNTTGTQSLYGGLTLPAVNASQVDTVYDVDGFVSAASSYYKGLGVAQTAYAGTTGYYQCSAVSYSGNNYLSVGYYTMGTAPGTSSAIWYPVPNANTPTALDCAFYTAAASLITGSGTITGNSQGSTVQLGIGTYNTCIGLMEPTVTTPGWWTVSIKGSAIGPSKIYQNCSISNPVLEQPPSTGNYDLARFLWENFTVDAHENAPAVVGLYGSQQSTVRNLDLYNAALGNDHYMEIGAAGNEGWVYELEMHNIQLGATYGGCNGATFSTAVTSGVPTVTVTNGGTGCNVNWPPTPVLIQPGGNFCNGTNTLTYSSGAITGWTTTASSCNSATTASVYSGPNVSYGFKFTNMSDSHDIDSLVCGGIGSVDCIYVSNVTSFNTFYKMHPIGTMDGIQNNGRNDFFATQMDSVFRRGFDFESGFGTVNVYGSLFEWANPTQENGAGDYFFGAVSNPPTNAPYSINIYGDMCGSSPTFTNYYHFSSSGNVVDTSSAGMPSTVHVHETNYCNQTGNSPTNAPDYVGLQYNWSPGAWGNVFQFNMNPTAGGTPTMTLTNPLTISGSNQGVYDWDWGTATAATSSLNPKSPITGWCSPYWSGSASTPLCVNTQLSYASGSNPLATLAFTYTGTLPTAGARYTFDSPVILPAASTAVTQTTGDNTTKIATDAFVLANGGSSPVTSVFGRVAAVAAQSGDYTIAQITNALPQFNVLSYQSAGATADTWIAACLTAAKAVAGYCDASALTGTVNMAANAGIVVGDTSDDPVGLKLPCNATWNFNITNGTGDMLDQYPNTSVWSDCSTVSNNTPALVQNSATSGGTNYGYRTVLTSTAGWYYATGFAIVQHGQGFNSGTEALIQAGQDASYWGYLQFFDSSATDSYIEHLLFTTGGICCGSVLDENFAEGNSTGGVPLYISGSSSNLAGIINIRGGRFNHPRSGLNNILCQDTSSTPQAAIDFSEGVYLETNTADNATPAIIQVSGCAQVQIAALNVRSFTSTAMTRQVINISSARNTSFSIGTLHIEGSATLPNTQAIVNANGSTIPTNATGDIVGYNSLTTYLEGVSAASMVDTGLTPSTSPICPNGTAGAFTTTGCSGSGSSAWSSLSNPTGNLALTMAAYSSNFTYNATTGTSDLFKLTDTASNTGTGIMAHFTTAAGSTETPWQADANGTGWKVDAIGNLDSTNAVNNAAITFQSGSSGVSTCPTAASGSSFLCTNAGNGISYSNNGAAYSPLSAQAIPYTITSSSTPALNLNNGPVQAITLSANATATVSNISAGVSLTVQICQPASGGPYTWTWPAGIHGGLTIGATASNCSIQEFRSFNGTTLVAINQGIINVAP